MQHRYKSHLNLKASPEQPVAVGGGRGKCSCQSASQKWGTVPRAYLVYANPLSLSFCVSGSEGSFYTFHNERGFFYIYESLCKGNGGNTS